MADREGPEETAAMRRQWDSRYAARKNVTPEAARVLRENLHLLPEQGDALDLACGQGGNARLLASRGLVTQAWDFSPVVIEQLRALEVSGLQASTRDVMVQPPAPGSVDVLVVSYFLDRRLFPHLRAALRPRGLLFYQTFLREQVFEGGPRNPDYRLGNNELLRLLAPLRILVYREEGGVGNVRKGFRNEAYAVAMRE